MEKLYIETATDQCGGQKQSAIYTIHYRNFLLDSEQPCLSLLLRKRIFVVHLMTF